MDGWMETTNSHVENKKKFNKKKIYTQEENKYLNYQNMENLY